MIKKSELKGRLILLENHLKHLSEELGYCPYWQYRPGDYRTVRSKIDHIDNKVNRLGSKLDRLLIHLELTEVTYPEKTKLEKAKK